MCARQNGKIYVTRILRYSKSKLGQGQGEINVRLYVWIGDGTRQQLYKYPSILGSDICARRNGKI